MLNTLTLIVPHLDPLRAQEDADSAARWPQLARLAGRGLVRRRRIDPHRDSVHAAVLDALALSEVADRYPSAAVMRTGATGHRASGFWLRAQPIHFAAGLDRLTTVLLRGEARMNAMEGEQLSLVLAEHLQSTGLELHASVAGEWLLRSAEPLQIETVSPEFAATNPAAEILPRGRDAGALRRLMTEMQMLLHEHPVNLQRQARNLPALNAIWIHGEGMLSDVSTVSLPEACGDDVYLQGVCRLHERAVPRQPVDAAALLAQVKTSTVAVVDVADIDALEAQWIAPLSRALRSGTIAKLTVMLEGWQVTADRVAMFKLWRRELQPKQWAAC
jgi:hypothetical protein